jgi:arylsulfatase A-like enzyme
MKYPHRIGLIAALISGIITNDLAAAEARQPNVVFFLVDDLGWSDISCYGSKFYETPAIDQLAKEGMLFDNAYSTCHVCSPSRASILTGKYPARTNLTEWLGGRPEREYEKLHHGEKLTALPDDEQTLAETLHKHGYATANYGKAHLNQDPKTYGFDEAITGWVRSYYHPFSSTYTETLLAKEGDYYTDKLTDAAIDFIERNKDKPFFVHLEHFSVHDPIQGRKDLVQKYQKKLATLPRQEGPDYILEPNPDGPAISGDKLKALEENDSSESHQNERVWWVKQKQDNVEFAGMVEATDESLGRIREKLKELGLEDNTIVIFTADNGGMSASNQYRGINHSREALNSRYASSNLPLRGAKGWNYEGGIRVPLIVHWPGKTQPDSTSNAVVTGTDYYPTLLEMLDLPALPDQHKDGRSFVAALNAEDYDRGPIYWHFPHYSNHGFQSPNGAIRSGRHKLIEYYENGTVQLFDLKNDIGEQNDLAKSQPDVAKKLKKMLHDWRAEVDAKMPYPKTATSKPAPGARVARPEAKGAAATAANLPADVEKFAPGWKIKNWGGPGMKPGLRKEWQGRSNVLLTHPRSKDVPCILSRSFEVPAEKKNALQFAVNNHPKGNWTLVVRIDGDEVLEKSIEDSSWQEFRFDLTKHAGETVRIELENRASDWSFEAAYWNRIELLDE